MGEWENDLKNPSLACFGETQNPIKNNYIPYRKEIKLSWYL